MYGNILKTTLIAAGLISVASFSTLTSANWGKSEPRVQHDQGTTYKKISINTGYRETNNLYEICHNGLSFIFTRAYSNSKASSLDTQLIQVMDSDGKPKEC